MIAPGRVSEGVLSRHQGAASGGWSELAAHAAHLDEGGDQTPLDKVWEPMCRIPHAATPYRIQDVVDQRPPLYFHMVYWVVI